MASGVIIPNIWIILVSVIGILLSLYLLYVDFKLKKNKNYKATCDINNKISCTKAASSNYGHIFGISNALIGLGYYFIVLILAYFSMDKVIFYLSIPAILMTLYLIYVSYFKMKSYCIVCHGTYIANITILILSLI